MKNDKVVTLKNPGVPGEVQDLLTEILREGAQQLLAQAIEMEVAEFLDRYRDVRDDTGRRRMVRNGHLPSRTIQTGIGEVPVKAPRVRDREGTIRFTSSILPPYLRRTKTIEELLPWLYLKGISTGDFGEALAALLGRDAPGLSAGTVSRLKAVWQQEHGSWERRSLANRHYVYLWIDGIHFGVRLEEANQCILVVIGATVDGKKELVALSDGFRESEESWRELLRDLKRRGLTVEPKLAVGDGALGFWKALPGLRQNARPALLGAQDRQHPEQVAQTPATQSEVRPACHLDGGHARGCGKCLRCLPFDVRTEVPEGRRVPVEGPGSAACLLRLPRRALGAFAHNEPD